MSMPDDLAMRTISILRYVDEPGFRERAQRQL